MLYQLSWSLTQPAVFTKGTGSHLNLLKHVAHNDKLLISFLVQKPSELILLEVESL